MKVIFVIVAWYLLMTVGFAFAMNARDLSWKQRFLFALAWPLLITERRG